MEYLHKFFFVYIDDVTFSKSLDEHILHLKLIFGKLLKYNLKLQLDKSEFLRKNVPFLGHVITPEWIKPNEEKIKAIQKYPLPRIQKEIKSFFDLLRLLQEIYKKFHTLYKMPTQRRKNKLNYFEKCKQFICNAPVLAYQILLKRFTWLRPLAMLLLAQPYRRTESLSHFSLERSIQPKEIIQQVKRNY